MIKLVPPGTVVDYVRVRGATGVWLSGAPHEFFAFDREGQEYREELALAGNVFVWERGALAYRLESALSREQTIAVAASVR